MSALGSDSSSNVAPLRRPLRRGGRRDVGRDEVVRRDPVRELRAVDAGTVELLDRRAQRLHAVGDPRPLDRQAVVGPVDEAVLVQVGEQELAAEAVVVAHARAGDREAEQAVEEDRVLDVAGEREALLLQAHGLAERGQVAAQLLERVHPVRAALADHERVERQVAVAVGAVVDEVPQQVGLERELLGAQQRRGVGREVQPQQRRPRGRPARGTASTRGRQKIAPKLLTGRPATATVSGNRTAHSLS